MTKGKNDTMKNKKKLLLLLGIVVISIFLVFDILRNQIKYTNLKHELKSYQEQRNELNQNHEELIEDNDSLKRQIHTLRNDIFDAEVELNKIEGLEIEVSIDKEYIDKVKKRYPEGAIPRDYISLKLDIKSNSPIERIEGYIQIYYQKEFIYQSKWANYNNLRFGESISNALELDMTNYVLEQQISKHNWNPNDLEFKFYVTEIVRNNARVLFDEPIQSNLDIKPNHYIKPISTN